MLQQGFGRPCAKNRCLGGQCQAQERRTPAAVPTAVNRSTENGDLARTAKTELLPQGRYQLVLKRDQHCYHRLCTCTHAFHGRYLHLAGPRAMGHSRCMEGYDRASKLYNEKQRGAVLLGSEATSLPSCHMTYNPT